MITHDLALSAEQRRLQALAKQIADNAIRPAAAWIDEADEFPREIYRVLSEAGIGGIMIPHEYGGLEEGLLSATLVQEELAKASASVCIVISVPMVAGLALAWYGTTGQKRAFLPELASGRKLFNFSITEPDGGSDVASMQTNAVADGHGYVINGYKHYVGNASVADYFSIYAKTDPQAGFKGISLFIVPKDTPGISCPQIQKKMGVRGAVHGDVALANCRVPEDSLVGKPGEGFLIAMRTLAPSRVLLAAQCAGVAQEAYEQAVRHAKQRVTFGKPLAQHQAITFMLADMAVDIHAARLMTYDTARLSDLGTARITREASMTKLFASDMVMRVTDKALRVFGGEGYRRGSPAGIERLFRDARSFEIMEGTAEMQRIVISRELLRG